MSACWHVSCWVRIAMIMLWVLSRAGCCVCSTPAVYTEVQICVADFGKIREKEKHKENSGWEQWWWCLASSNSGTQPGIVPYACSAAWIANAGGFWVFKACMGFRVSLREEREMGRHKVQSIILHCICNNIIIYRAMQTMVIVISEKKLMY